MRNGEDDPELVMIDEPGDLMTVQRFGESITVPSWVLEFTNCGFNSATERMNELWIEHIKSAADLYLVFELARILLGWSREQIIEVLLQRRNVH